MSKMTWCPLNHDEKNQEGKIIVLYDNDELLAHRAATTLVQRGYDNLFILSGGQLSWVSSLIVSRKFVFMYFVSFSATEQLWNS